MSKIEDPPNVINILLLGETGVGKSTFINSFPNYMRSCSFQEATGYDTHILIPTLITVYDKKRKVHTFTIGNNNNEKQNIGSSATQGVKHYLFRLKDKSLTIRLIDTPGIGDTEGVDQDNRNCEAILAYLAQLKKVNAICLLLNPTHSRNTTMFGYCIRRILSQLHKDAANNMVFVFTNTKGSSYNGGDTLPILKDLAEEVAKVPPHVKISIEDDNVFCLDNEGLKHLLALQLKVTFDDRTLRGCEESWDVSCKETKRFVDYVRKLHPHNVQQTVSVNRTRELIFQLSKPISDICQLLQEKIIILREKEDDSNRANQTIEELKKNLYKPEADLEIIPLKQSVLVCTNLSCVEPVKVGVTTKIKYKKPCHDPCRLGYVSYEKMGHFSLLTCSQITLSFKPTCKQCGCSYKKHMTIYYDTKIVEKQVINQDVQSNLLSEDKQRAIIQAQIAQMKEETKELEEELKFISQCAAGFAYYLQNNAITSAYDDYKGYLQLSLERQIAFGAGADSKIVLNLQQLLNRHEDLIKNLTKNKGQYEGRVITEESINIDAEKIFALKHSGVKIKQIFDARIACAKNATVPLMQELKILS